MRKTTVYLPDGLKADVERCARELGRSEAEVIRAALAEYTARNGRPRPRLPLFHGTGVPTDLASRDEEYLAEGFGRD
ncbi:MAG: ribbon-helix-helix protein, CopG family [Thermoleophilia bacterium]|nr:ribbon-helix-helix protein, CopG family [Thermoleophilia bacterium]